MMESLNLNLPRARGSLAPLPCLYRRGYGGARSDSITFDSPLPPFYERGAAALKGPGGSEQDSFIQIDSGNAGSCIYKEGGNAELGMRINSLSS